MLVHRQPILAIVVLWSLSQMARAFRFTFGSPTQCDDLNISWTDGTPPFQLLMIPVFGVPRNVSIPVDAFRDGQGSFAIRLPFPEGQKFLLTMSDSTGFASGGSTNVLVVGSSKGGQCDTKSPAVDFEFQLNTALQQCRPYLVSGYPGAVQPITFMGIVPGGTSFVLKPPLGSDSFNWNANVAQGTSVIFMMADSQGRSGGSSDVEIVGASGDSTCLNNLSPSSTSASPYSSVNPTSTASDSDTSATSSSNPSKGKTAAAIAGIVIGGLVFLAAVITLGLFFLRRKRDTWGAGGSKHSRNKMPSEVDLTFDPRYAPSTRGYSSTATVPAAPQMPFMDSNQYLNHPQHQTPLARYPLPSQYTQYPSTSHYQPPSFSTPDADPFNPYTHSDTSPSITNPAVNQPAFRDSMSTAQQKAAMAGGSAYTPSRLILHTDVEDATPHGDGGIVELPPQYSDRRGSLPPHDSVMPSSSQYKQ